MAYAEVNQQAQGFLPNRRLSDLAIGEYNITDIRIANTQKWGRKIVADIDNQYSIWFPKKVVTLLLADDEKWLKEMKADALDGNLVMCYKGGPGFLMSFRQATEPPSEDEA